MIDAASHAASRNAAVGVMAFLTVVDLFAAQAILPSLRAQYGVTPAAMSVAVNASTIGMAAAGLATALLSHRIPLRLGVVASLAALAVPTLLLAHAPDLATFAVLRIAQGLCMATAFALTLAYVGESAMSARDAATAFAAYVTGNVASNLVGRIMSSTFADLLGLSFTFYAFAALNLSGAALAAFWMRRDAARDTLARTTASGLPALLRRKELLAAFAIGFCILFAFIGVFTFANFVLTRPPFGVSPMSLGFVYLVFAPSIATTPLAGGVAARAGAPWTIAASLALAGLGLPLLALGHLGFVLPGLALVAVGTFAAQAAATGYVSRAAPDDRAAASGLYLASYFAGGLAGTALLGAVFDSLGWGACLVAIAVVLAGACGLARIIKERR